MHSILDYGRVEFASFAENLTSLDLSSTIHLLGEAFAGVGISTNMEYTLHRLDQWFGASSSNMGNDT